MDNIIRWDRQHQDAINVAGSRMPLRQRTHDESSLADAGFPPDTSKRVWTLELLITPRLVA